MLKTPLNDFHNKNGGSMVPFAGWEMPLFYKLPGLGIVGEHVQCRTSGGIFDVSHMGRLKVNGRQAAKFLERVCSRRIRDMKQGQCRYSLVCNPQGGIHDDVIVYRMEEDDFLVVVNASNREKIIAHFAAVKAGGGGESFVVNIEDTTMKTAMVAVQGPKVIDFISKVSREIPTLKRYSFTVKNLLIAKLTVSRTGYTGEDGVEVILPSGMVGMALTMLMKDIDPAKEGALIRPCGLGARDTLRLEAAMPLYGHELGEETNALGTTLDFAVSLDKDADANGIAFIGQDALKKTRDGGGPALKLVGIACEGRRSPRQGMKVHVDGREAGTVTSGAPAPTLGYPIAMAYVPAAMAAEGTAVGIDTGKGDGEKIPGRIVKMPFYKAAKQQPAAATV
ncbi:MAG TPA: glycine cleavage system aminomethyltransferase GcvT [Phycisphaerales bacterium]|nr:glycine cleavage system aminomethyltransferase GcvT [Phycisphaerales bacterium]